MPRCHVQLNSVEPLGAVNVTVFTSPWCMAPVLTCRPSMVKLWLLSPALRTSTVTAEPDHEPDGDPDGQQHPPATHLDPSRSDLAELRRPRRLRKLALSVDAGLVLRVHVVTFLVPSPAWAPRVFMPVWMAPSGRGGRSGAARSAGRPPAAAPAAPQGRPGSAVGRPHPAPRAGIARRRGCRCGGAGRCRTPATRPG